MILWSQEGSSRNSATYADLPEMGRSGTFLLYFNRKE